MTAYRTTFAALVRGEGEREGEWWGGIAAALNKTQVLWLRGRVASTRRQAILHMIQAQEPHACGVFEADPVADGQPDLVGALRQALDHDPPKMESAPLPIPSEEVIGWCAGLWLSMLEQVERDGEDA